MGDGGRTRVCENEVPGGSGQRKALVVGVVLLLRSGGSEPTRPRHSSRRSRKRKEESSRVRQCGWATY